MPFQAYSAILAKKIDNLEEKNDFNRKLLRFFYHHLH